MALLRWKSNGMLKVSIENITKSDSNFAKTFLGHQLFPDMNFTGHCLTKNNTDIPKKVINLHMSYTLGLQLRNLNKNFTSGSSLFGSVKLAENADLDKCIYTGYDIGFDYRSGFLFTDGSYGKKINSFLFVNATKVYQFKAKELEIKDDALCLGNISKDFTINNLKKQD